MSAVITEPASRGLAHPAREEIRLEKVLHALSDPIRLRMVREMAAADSGLACTAFDLPVTKSTATHHFRVLRESGVIYQVYHGTAKLSWLRTDDLSALFPGLLETMVDAATRQRERVGDA